MLTIPSIGRLKFVAIQLLFMGVVTQSVHAQERKQGSSDDGIINVLSSASERWAAAIRCQAAFKYYQGSVSGIDAGLGGELGRERSAPTANGFLAKGDDYFRMQLDYGRPPTDSTLDRSGKLLSKVSFDEVVGSDIFLTHYPKYANFGNTLQISRKAEEDRDSLAGAQSAHAILTPFNMGGGFDGGPLLSLKALMQPGDNWEQKVIQDDGDRIVIRMDWSNDQGMQQQRIITYWTKPSIPVVERVQDEYEDKRRGLANKTVTWADGFVDCEGGMLPSHLVFVHGPLITSDGSSTFMAREWVATDIEPRPAKDAFDLTVPTGTRLSGFRSPPSTVSGPVTIRLADYSINDLLDSGLSGQGPTEELSGKSVSTVRLAGIIATILFIFVLLFFVLHRRIYAA